VEGWIFKSEHLVNCVQRQRTEVCLIEQGSILREAFKMVKYAKEFNP
jgi:hypothetical protein